jgi:transposase
MTGCRWQDLPREYGAPTTVWRRLKRWGEAGVWERLWRAALAALDQHGRLDWSMAFLDGSFAPAKKGGDKVGLTKKGKGTKWMLVIDGNGLPLGFHLASANTAEVRLAEATLDTIAVARPRGRPRRRPEKLVADRAYDSSAFRGVLRQRGIGMCIPPKRRPARWRPKRGRPVVARMEEYRLRYRVERTFAWLGNFRRLLIRWEHHFAIYHSWFALAVAVLCVRRLQL